MKPPRGLRGTLSEVFRSAVATARAWDRGAPTRAVTIPFGDHSENWPVRSQMFGRWLAMRAYQASGAAPGA